MINFYLESGTLEKRPLKISVTRKRLPSRKTRNGLLRKDPLAYARWAILNSKTAANGSRQVQNRLEFSEIILTWVNY